jgi:CHAT domain-containing protein
VRVWLSGTLEAAEAAPLFHYAGHHRFAGAEGSESELLLSGATSSVGDVLTLSAAPRFVVLSACDSARLQAPAFAQVDEAPRSDWSAFRVITR